MTYGVRAYGARGYGDNSGQAAVATSTPVDVTITFTGTASAEASGTPVFTEIISLTGTPSAGASGTPTFSFAISGVGGSESRETSGIMGVLTAPAPPAFSTLGSEARRFLRLVDIQGEPVAEYPTANIESVVLQLNEKGSIRFSIPPADFVASVNPILHEMDVQAWRNNTLVHQAVLAKPQGGDQNKITFDCPGLFWHFEKRFFGKAARTNYLQNAEFEDPTLAPWTAFQCTAAVDTTHYNLNAQSLRLDNNQPDKDANVYQRPLFTAGGVGNLITVSGWFLIPSSSYVGPALHNFGIVVGKAVTFGADIGEAYSNSVINDETPKDVWTRQEVTIQLFPGETFYIETRLYCPQGTIYWDAVSMTLMESVSSDPNTGGTDQAEMCNRIVTHAQDPDFDKSDLFIGLNTPNTGIKRNRYYQFAEHGGIMSALSEYTSLQQGLDYNIELSVSGNTTTKTFTTYYPRKGVDHPELWLMNDDRGSNFATLNYSFDSDRYANSVVVMGQSNGPGREEAGKTGGAGPTIEKVQAAATDTQIDSLDQQAKELLRISLDATIVEILVTDPKLVDLLMTSIRPGDHINVDVGDDWFPAYGRMRIVTMEWLPQPDHVHLTLNPPA